MKFLLSYILINFILILTFYIIYFTNKSTNKENFAANVRAPVNKLTITDYVTSDIIKEKLFLMTDIDGNLSTVNKLNERFDIIKNNIQANTQSIKTNTTNIGKEKSESVDASGLYKKIGDNASNIDATAKSISGLDEKNINHERSIKAITDDVDTGIDTAKSINDSLAELLPLVDGELCGSKNFENTRGSVCRAIRYNDFMTIQNYGAKRKDTCVPVGGGFVCSHGWYLRVTGDRYPEYIRPSVLDKEDDGGDDENRGINTIWSIIPQATKTTTTTQPPPEQKPIWEET